MIRSKDQSQMSTEMEQQQWTKLHPQKQPTKPAMKQRGLLNCFTMELRGNFGNFYVPQKVGFWLIEGNQKKTTNHGNCAIYFYPGVS